MNGDLDGTTTVRVELRGRRATIADIQQAIDILRADGIPDTFEVDIRQSDDRGYDRDVPFSERPSNHVFTIEAERAAVTP